MVWIKGGLLGGLVLFVWAMISWMVLPWHNGTLLTFSDEDAVARVLEANAPERGVYIVPNPNRADPGADPALARAAAEERMRRGPRAFVAYDNRSLTSMGRPMGGGLVIQVIGALCLTFLLARSRGTYWSRVGLASAAGLFAGIIADLPNWNWWGFSSPFTIVAVADHVIGATLAGLVIAWAVGDLARKS